MAGVVFKLPAWLFVVFLLTGICIVPFTFELFLEFSLILTFVFPNTLNFSKIAALFPVLLLCVGRPPPPSRGATGVLYFIFTPFLYPGRRSIHVPSGIGSEAGQSLCGQRYLFSRGIFCNLFVPSCSKEIYFAKCFIVATSRVASYYVYYFSSYKWPFCLITLYDVFVSWK